MRGASIKALGLRIGLSLCLVAATSLSFANEHRIPAANGDIVIHPIRHATFAMSWNGLTLYADAVGKQSQYAGLPKPDLILVTDIHGDHMNAETLQAVAGAATSIIVPAAVAAELPEGLKKQLVILANGETRRVKGIEVTAVPMYNLDPQLHPKGRGNGYVILLGGKHIYVSGDTDDIPEMRALRNIDIAFLCMLVPYTMSVEKAADAVREFRPRIVFPYHYQDSDVKLFRTLVEKNAPGVEVRLDNWYPDGQN